MFHGALAHVALSLGISHNYLRIVQRSWRVVEAFAEEETLNARERERKVWQS